MKKYLFLLLILVVLAACSSNKTADKDNNKDCNEINLEQALEQSRAENQKAVDKLYNDLETYRKNLNSGMDELEALRKEIDAIMNDPDSMYPDTEQLKTYVSDKDKDAARTMNKIEYEDKLEFIKTRIADIEKFMRENCYGFSKQ
jgi:predicted  nucleic acid-binding Zn-ribbon protein